MPRRFGYQCEYCEGTVREKLVDREAFKHRDGFVILTGVAIGICDRCGNKYYSADTLQQVEALARGDLRPDETEAVPVAQAINTKP